MVLSSQDERAESPTSTDTPMMDDAEKKKHQPFFIMDWLDELYQDQDAERVAELLKTPQKDLSSFRRYPSTPKSSNKKKRALSTGSRTPPPPQIPSMNHHHQRSTSFAQRSKSTGELSPPNNIRKLNLPKQNLFPTSSSDPSFSMDADDDEDITKMPPPPPPSIDASSPFFSKSIAIGNGWNAKGLKKAKLGLWNDALQCWDNALEIRGQLLGEKHLDVANTYNNRGIALGKLGHLQQAQVALHKALDIRTALLGQTHVQVAATLHNLANVHQQAGELETALELLGHSKQIQLDLHNGCEVARACMAMGHVYYEARQLRDAGEAYRDALLEFQRAGVPDTDRQVQDIRQDLKELERLQLSQHHQQQQQHYHQQQQQQRTHPHPMDASPASSHSSTYAVGMAEHPSIGLAAWGGSLAAVKASSSRSQSPFQVMGHPTM